MHSRLSRFGFARQIQVTNCVQIRTGSSKEGTFKGSKEHVRGGGKISALSRGGDMAGQEGDMSGGKGKWSNEDGTFQDRRV